MVHKSVGSALPAIFFVGLTLLSAIGFASAQEKVTVVGTLTEGGAECPVMSGDDGRTYSLVPREALGLSAFGARVRVVGVVQEVSFCQQGTTIEVESIEPAG